METTCAGRLCLQAACAGRYHGHRTDGYRAGTPKITLLRDATVPRYTDNRNMTTYENLSDPQGAWDSESRKSPYSTVCDPNEDDFCEECQQDVDYSDGSEHGKCGCENA